MPSESAKQHRFMEAVAHNPDFAEKVGVKQSVGKDFAAADDAAGITKKPHTENQKRFFHSKSFVPKGGIIDASRANGTVDAMTAGSKVRPTQ